MQLKGLVRCCCCTWRWGAKVRTTLRRLLCIQAMLPEMVCCCRVSSLIHSWLLSSEDPPPPAGGATAIYAPRLAATSARTAEKTTRRGYPKPWPTTFVHPSAVMCSPSTLSCQEHLTYSTAIHTCGRYVEKRSRCVASPVVVSNIVTVRCDENMPHTLSLCFNIVRF